MRRLFKYDRPVEIVYGHEERIIMANCTRYVAYGQKIVGTSQLSKNTPGTPL